MMRVKLVVAYDGTNYHGWQLQPNAVTIESELNRALTELLKEPVQVIGASRTDAGVHSMGTVAVFDTNTRMPAEKISYAVNQRLPEDIRVQSSEQCADDFHPRHCESRKTYRYQIYSAPFPMPSMRLYAHYTHYSFDVGAMRRAAEYLKGTHDFKSFCATAAVVESTVRTLYDVTVTSEVDHDRSYPGRDGGSVYPELITIQVTGNGFLYNMVRIIAGTLMEIGLHRYPPEQIKDILEACDRQAAGPTAPANGLMLYSYQYLSEKSKKLVDTRGCV